MVLYVSPRAHQDTSAWYKIATELDEIRILCSTQVTGYGGSGAIGRNGELAVGMVYSHSADSVGGSGVADGVDGGNGTVSEEVIEWLLGEVVKEVRVDR